MERPARPRRIPAHTAPVVRGTPSGYAACTAGSLSLLSWSLVMRKWCASALAFLFALTAAPAAEKPLPQPWDYAAAMKKVAAKFHGRPGVVLHVGDSITYANPYGQWAPGEGKTDEDKAILKWMHAGADNDTDGWYLARFDHPDGGRSYTACSGIRADEMLAGGKNKMPPLAKILDDVQAADGRPHARHQRRLGGPRRRRLLRPTWRRPSI